MPVTKNHDNAKLPGRFEDLVALMPPEAIVGDIQLKNTIEMIDSLMASGKLTKGQASYMETLVQLVQAYEAAHGVGMRYAFSILATLKPNATLHQ